MARALTNKQQMAVNAYLEGMDKTAACRAAGYSSPRDAAQEVFAAPAVVKAIDERHKAIQKRVDIKIDDVLEGLMDGVNAAQNTADLVMAWREIGKIIGAYEHVKKYEMTVTKQDVTAKQLERMSDEQLAELVGMEGELIIEADYVEVEDDPDARAV